ncbi:MAG TPA: GNAT family N-acetyltransferase [Vicinamibacterales bacterium]|nr:GNAT family N-acetyltransferase [Vicinamibacterales bacterium]
MMAFEVRAARTEGEVAQAYEVATRVFGPNYHESRATKDRMLRLEPPTDLRDLLVAVAGDEVVGVLRIVDRDVELGSGVARVGGITTGAVRPDFRRSGCGWKLFEASIERSRERGDLLSIGFARRAMDGYYPRLGYVGLGGHVKNTYTVPSAQGDNPAIVTAFDPELIGAYGAAYDNTYGGLTMRFMRTTSWWASLRDRSPWLRADGFVTVMVEDTPAGYYVEHGGTVMEAAWLPGQMPLVASAVLAGARARRSELSTSLSPSHPLSATLAALNHTTSMRRAWDGGHIVRIVDRDGLAALLAEHCSADERAAWRSFDVRSHVDARNLLMLAAAGSMSSPPVWSELDAL